MLNNCSEKKWIILTNFCLLYVMVRLRKETLVKRNEQAKTIDTEITQLDLNVHCKMT